MRLVGVAVACTYASLFAWFRRDEESMLVSMVYPFDVLLSRDYYVIVNANASSDVRAGVSEGSP